MLKYEVVAQDIRDRIASGEYKPNEQLPTTEELCEAYEVSKITIKRAMDELVLEGLVARRRGSGSFVKGIGEQAALAGSYGESSRQMTGFSSEHQGDKVATDVHDFSVVVPPASVATALNMEKDEFAYHLIRVRIANDIPRVVEYTYMPLRLIPGLREKHAQSSIYQYIEGDLGLKIASAHRTVRAVSPTEQEAAWLHVKTSDPILEVEQVAFFDDGVPFEYSISRHARGYEFHTVSIH